MQIRSFITCYFITTICVNLEAKPVALDFVKQIQQIVGCNFHLIRRKGKKSWKHRVMKDSWIKIRADNFFWMSSISSKFYNPLHLFYCHNLHLDDEFLEEFCLEFGLNSVFDLLSISFTSY